MMNYKPMIVGGLVAALAALGSPSVAASDRSSAGEPAFRALYKELVETNTTLSSGSCTLAAERVATRLRAAGYTDAELTPFAVPEHPKDGGLVAVLPGTDAKAKAILLLAHIDVVEAKAEDWTRDPFKLVEENGFFYARGASDDKAMAAIFADTMIRLRAGPRPRRTVKLALTCGEETTDAFNGADWLAQNRRQLIDAAFALNEGGGGRLDAQGRPFALSLQVSEKTAQNYTLETHNAGGHSSLPRPDNAIYQLAGAIDRIAAYRFPVHLDATTRAFFTRTARIAPTETAAAMTAIVANPDDKAADAVLSRDPLYNSTLRTTCVVTLLDAGHAENALPQHARANVNCRIFPGETVDGTAQALGRIVADPGVVVTTKPQRGPASKAAVLDPAVLGPAETLTARRYPGLPLIPMMSTGATDSIYLAAVGIPSYGVPGILREPDGGGIHGLNEHIRVKSLLDGRDYLYDLIRMYAAAG